MGERPRARPIAIGVCVIVLAAILTTAAGSAAISNTSITVTDDSPGAATDHYWSTDVDSGTSNTLSEVHLNYSGTGTNVSEVTVADIGVTVNRTAVTVEQVDSLGGNERLAITVRNRSLTGDEAVRITTENRTVVNPPMVGEYNPTIEFYNSTQLFATQTTPLTITNNTVQGTVTNESGGTLEGGTVSAIQDGTAVNETVTSTDGTYDLGVSSGEYSFVFDADGYVPNETGVFINGNETINATLERGGTITGIVTNESGTAIQGASIRAVNDETYAVYEATTNETGGYSIDVPAGNYRVTADSDGYVRDTADVSVDAVGTTTTRDFALMRAGVVAGTVTNESGRSVTGASVTVKDGNGNFYSASTDGDGNYSVEVPEGTYTVTVDNAGYAPAVTNDVSVQVGSTTTTDVALSDAAIIKGTIVDESGDPVSNASVEAYDSSFEIFQWTETDSQGRYRLEVANGTYTIEATANGYATTTIDGVNATEGNATAREVGLEPAAVVTGVVENETGGVVENADVVVHDDGYQVYESTTTDQNGTYSVEVPEGSYTVRADAGGYAPETTTVDAAAGRSTSADFTIGEPAIITGTVYDEAGDPNADAVVVADNGDDFYDTRTNASGGYELEVPDGDFSVTAFSGNETGSGDYLEGVTTGTNYSVDIGMVNPTISHSSVKYVGNGTAPANMSDIGVRGDAFGGFMVVQLVNETNPNAGLRPHDLTGMGVDTETEFEINFTVKNYDPNSLFHGVRDVEWSTTENETMSNATDVTVRTKPVNLQAINSQPVGLIPRDYEGIDWPTGADDKASVGWENTVHFGLFDLSNVPGSVARNMNNMTIATNAQAFSRPQVTDDGLKIYVAGPHVDTSGINHNGFYSAFIPDAQLESWGVDDPQTDLNALYKGSSTGFTVEETSDGAWIHLDVDYSDGTVAIEPAASNDESNDGERYIGSGDDSDDSDERDETDRSEGETDSEGETENATDSERKNDGTAGDESEGESSDGSGSAEPTGNGSEPTDGDSVPGFGVGTAIGALLATVLLRRLG